MAKAVNTVIDIDRGYKGWRRYLRRNVRGPHVRIGVQGDEAAEKHEAGISNAALAAIHEFGTEDGTIPSRPFLRGTMTRNQELFARMLRRAAERAARAKQNKQGVLEQQLGRVGERGVAEVRRTIDQTIGLKGLEESTKAGKGSSTPLLDTGALKGSITYKVMMK